MYKDLPQDLFFQNRIFYYFNEKINKIYNIPSLYEVTDRYEWIW
jgi:hypothetical protein